jgi:plasmid stabilization system protein ParE
VGSDQIDELEVIGDIGPPIASRFVARVIERAREIGDNPLSGRASDEPNVRVVVAPRLRHLIFHTIAADEIHVTTIRHTSRRRPSRWGR